MQQVNFLYKRSVLFVDVFNVVLYTDLFMFHELKKRSEKNQVIKFFFNEILETECDDTRMIQLFAGKSHQNILLDWLNINHFLEVNDEDDIIPYIMDLYYDLLVNPICTEYMQMTQFGNSLRLLMMDSNVTKVIFYTPFESQAVYDNIKDGFFGVDFNKIQYCSGDKEEIYKQAKVHSYILENVDDIDKYLSVPHIEVIEVLIPTYKYNMAKDLSEFEELLGNLLFHRINLINEPREYLDKYKLSINTIGVPI